jgi:hypothetical protein
MAAVRIAFCAALLGGCLIVRTTEGELEEPCPEPEPEILAESGGPFVLGDDVIYFIGVSGTLAKVPIAGGQVSELTLERVRANALALDAGALYWAADASVIRYPLDGTPLYILADGFPGLTELVVDDTNVVWASTMGLDRWSKLDDTVSHLSDAIFILGLSAYDGLYYYSDTHGDSVRRAPPTQELAVAHLPGPLVVDEQGVYFYEVNDAFVLYAGAIRHMPRDGGAIETTLDDLYPVLDLAMDAEHLYYVTAYGVEYRVKQVSRSGGEPTTLACGPFRQERIFLAVENDHVYWSDSNRLYRIAP